MLTLLLFLASSQQVAVLDSGARIECSKAPLVGSRVVVTEHGAYDAGRDPVASVVDGAEDRRLLAPLRELDYSAWIRRMAERGQLKALLAENPEGELRLVWLDALAGMGRNIDPLPSNTPRDERIEDLWKRLDKADGGVSALLCGRLEVEISDASTASPNLKVGLVDLRRSLRDRNPDRRWIGARLALRQHEVSMTHALLEASLEDEHPASRAAAAASLHGMEPEASLAWWTLGMWRERSSQARVSAVGNLAVHGSGNPYVVKALVMTLSAADHHSPGSYAFFGRQITVVADFDVEVALAAAIADPQVSTITEGAVLAVRVVGASVTTAVRGALQKLTGANPGPSAREWSAWMKENLPEVSKEK
jgi:hypothetical protein